MIPEPLPPAPLYPEHPDLYRTDVYVATMEGIDVYWAPVGQHGEPDPCVIVVRSSSAGLGSFDTGLGWQAADHIPESVKRFAESIYRLHV